MGTKKTEMKLLSPFLLGLAYATEDATGSETTGSEATGGETTAEETPTVDPCSFDASILTCADNKMTLDVPYCSFEKASMAVGSVFMGGDVEANQIDACAGVLYAEGGSMIDDFDPATVTAETILPEIVKMGYENGVCGISTSSDDEHIYYQGLLYGKVGTANAVISREKLVDMPIKCDFDKELTVSVENFFKPLVSSVNIEMDSVSSNFEVEMSLFSDEAMATALDAEHEVNVPDPIYGKVDLEEGLDFHVQLRTCWATPTDDANDAQKYSFIENFAAVDGDNMEITNNCGADPATFWINSFAFVTADDTAAGNVYLHCEVHLCDPASEGDCSCAAAAAAEAAAESGSTRKRRAIAVEANKPRATLKVGPISVQK